MAGKKILIADDTKLIVKFFKDALKDNGYDTIEAFDGEEAFAKARSEEPDAIILDIKMPKMDGIETLRKMRQAGITTPVIIITGYSSLTEALEAVKLGISDFLTKPVELSKLEKAVKKALNSADKTVKHGGTAREYGNYDIKSLHLITGNSPAIKNIHELVGKVAPHNVNVLIRGESGTGKEIIARAIHFNSARNRNPLISVDCSAIPESLVESELFGFEKGAFTGADKQHTGKFELAAGGTLFLDEIGNLPVATQAKLLRVLQEKEIVRVGGNTRIKADVRVITATNTDLEEAIKKGAFRQDLYHRISEFTLILPALKERREDIPFLMDLLLKEFNAEFGKTIFKFSPRVKELLQKFSWPGNIRELRNVIKSAVLIAEHDIEFNHLPLNIQVAVDERKMARPGDTLKDAIARATEELERKIILQALNENEWNQQKTAKELGIDPKTLYRKMKDYNIEKE